MNSVTRLAGNFPFLYFSIWFVADSSFTRNHEAEKQHRCQKCDVDIGSEIDLTRHEEIWHSARDTWSCPTEHDIDAVIHLQTGPLARYFFPTSQPRTVSEEDA